MTPEIRLMGVQAPILIILPAVIEKGDDYSMYEKLVLFYYTLTLSVNRFHITYTAIYFWAPILFNRTNTKEKVFMRQL